MRLMTLLFAVSVSATILPAVLCAQDTRSLEHQRQYIINAILSSDRPDSVAALRWVCLSGDQPMRVREARSEGDDFTPDASASCLAALKRKGQDHALLESYKKLEVSLNGNPDYYDKLPKAIGAAVLNGDGKVSIGNGKAIVADAALAFDAGFTVAYISVAPKKQGFDEQKLKQASENCLDKKDDAGTCFSIGYALGSFAVNAR